MQNKDDSRFLTRAELEEQGEDKELLDVRDFHHRFQLLAFDRPVHLTQRKLKERVECMQEELEEFWQASQKQDLAALFDALIDLVYFAKGTAVMLGLPWRQGWDEVQRANMAKVPGVTRRGHAVDVTKPPGWTAPDLETVLHHAGYNPNEWGRVYKLQIDEARCYDDPKVILGEVVQAIQMPEALD